MRSKFFYTNLLFILAAIIIYVTAPSHRSLFLGVMLAVYSLTLAAGCSFIAWNFFLISQNKLPSNQKHNIALTFDDGPLPHSATILEILKEYDVKASFFLVGKQVEQSPALARRMLNEGHIIGNHSMSHGHLVNLKLTGGTIDEINQCNVTIQKHTGFTPTLFRPPHGVVTHHLAWALERTQMRSIGWSIRSFDTASKNEAALLQRLKKQLHDRAIILVHDFCPITAAVLPRFIDYARTQGFEFVTI